MHITLQEFTGVKVNHRKDSVYIIPLRSKGEISDFSQDPSEDSPFQGVTYERSAAFTLKVAGRVFRGIKG